MACRLPRGQDFIPVQGHQLAHGYIHCHAKIPIGLCNSCGWKRWNQEAEAIIEQVVRREYDKLPRPG
jgi:hypothetical protein